MMVTAVRAVPRAFSASSGRFSPRRREMIDAVPTPIAWASAETMVCNGKTIDRAAMARGPTPCPTKIVSTTL